MAEAGVKFTKSKDKGSTGSEVTILKQEQPGEAAEKPNRNSKLPSERVVLLVLCLLLAAAIVVICRLSVMMANQSLQSLKEENEALRKHLSDNTCLKCGAGWMKHEGKCFYFNTNISSWSNSRASCRDLGGDLVKIDSREEQEFLVGKLRGLMSEAEDKFWIGLTDSETEGRWLWADGSPLNESLSFWRGKEPDNWKGIEDCVRMGALKEDEDLNRWFDRSCDNPHKSICEKSAETGSYVCV